jgi:hypothetical protein
VQNQPASDPPPESAGRSAAEFRPIAALGFLACVFILGGFALVDHGIATWITAATGICLASIALHRLRKERAFVMGRATTLATVTHWEIAEGSERRQVYSVQYRFVGPDGKGYVGQQTSQVQLPKLGEPLPISYMRVDPSQNLPFATFWFYRFTESALSDGATPARLQIAKVWVNQSRLVGRWSARISASTHWSRHGSRKEA